MKCSAATSTMPVPRTEIAPGIWLDGRRAVFFEPERLLAVADLHWGYTESHRARGHLLPDWGDAEIARLLHAVVAEYRPAEMLWLGDSLHASDGRTAAEAFLREVAVPVTLIAGNHDARWPAARDREVVRGRYRFFHGDRPRPATAGLVDVVGHHHPAFVWRDGAGARVKVPLLVVSPGRLILPAFSPWAAGAAWSPQEPGETHWVITRRRIFALPAPASPPAPLPCRVSVSPSSFPSCS